MKLQSFRYTIHAQAEYPWFRVLLSDGGSTLYSFMAYELNNTRTRSWTNGIIISSAEIRTLRQSGATAAADELQSFFISLFRCHRSAIIAATAGTPASVKVYSHEIE